MKIKIVPHKVNIKDFNISNPKKTSKASSHINEKGNIIKNKYYDIKYDDMDIMENYKTIDDLIERKRKKKNPKSKRKGCGCK